MQLEHEMVDDWVIASRNTKIVGMRGKGRSGEEDLGDECERQDIVPAWSDARMGSELKSVEGFIMGRTSNFSFMWTKCIFSN